jgi:uncharacterized protein (TIGR04255 family)
VSNYPHLARAPITEAIIDIRVKAREGASGQDFGAVSDELRPRFTFATELRRFAVTVQPGQPGVIQKDEAAGLLFKTDDGKTLVQFRVDGFTYNKLAPYSSWEEIFPETLRLWEVYLRTARPESVVRVATRYINRLRLPLPITDLDEYLTAPPQIPKGMPQTLRGYLLRLVVYDEINDHSVILTQAPEGNPLDDRHVTLLLDIDAYKDVDHVPPDRQKLEAILMRLRDAKNTAFYSSITKRTQDMFV